MTALASVLSVIGLSLAGLSTYAFVCYSSRPEVSLGINIDNVHEVPLFNWGEYGDQDSAGRGLGAEALGSCPVRGWDSV